MKTSSGNSKNFPDAQQHRKSLLWLHLVGHGQLPVVDYVSLFKTELDLSETMSMILAVRLFWFSNSQGQRHSEQVND